MKFEQWQEIWRQQTADAATQPDRLAEQVRQQARDFDRMVVWRDWREGLGAGGVAIVFGLTALHRTIQGGPALLCWSAAALPVAVVGFLLADRWAARARARERRPAEGRKPTADDTVLAELDRAIVELRHQHWLLHHVLWWYLLPLAASAGLIILDAILRAPVSGAAKAGLAGVGAAILAAVNFSIWRLNRGVAARELQPCLATLEQTRRDFLAG